MHTKDDGKLTAIACLLGTMLGWGCIPIFLRHFTTHLDSWTVNAVRYLVGALFWLPFVVVLHRRHKAAGSPTAHRSVWRDALVPTSVNVIGQVGYAVSPYFIPAPTVGFVMRLSFLFTVLFGFLFLAEERPLARRGTFWWGVAVSAGGLVLMFVGKLQVGSPRELVGVGIAAASTVAWGAYSVSVRKRMAGYPVRLSFGVISLYTAGVLVLLMVVFGRAGRLGQLSGGLWVALVGTGLIGVAMGHVLYYRAIHRLGPIVSSGVLLATPFVTMVGAWLSLRERLGVVELAGGLGVVLGGAVLLVAKVQLEKDRLPTGPQPEA